MEAARRAGKRMYTLVFVLCPSLAALGGTCLFSGRGSAFSALLGILVIQSISSGLTLLDPDSSFRFMVTGLALALAVTLDSVARRSRAAHGRA